MKLFQRVDEKMVKPGVPPLVCFPAVTGHIPFKSKDELKAWEEDLRDRLGAPVKLEIGISCETCSGGCSDDCG